MIELSRTENTITHALAGNVFRQKVSSLMHYYNHNARGDGVYGWRKSDVRWIGLRSEYGPFSIEAPLYANGPITFANLRSDGHKHNSFIIQSESVCNPADYIVDGERVIYPDAFGVGSDLILELRSSGVARLVRVRAGFTPQPGYRFSFITDKRARLVRLSKTPYEIDARGPKKVDTDSSTLLDDGSSVSYLRPFRAWDGTRSGVISATIQRTPSGFNLIKVVPAWWDGATDLYMDDTSTVSPSTSDGSVFNIDTVANSLANWNTARNAVTGDGIDGSGTTLLNVAAYYRTTGGTFRFQRSFSDYTPALAAGDTVTAVTLDYYETSSIAIADDIVIVPGSQSLPPAAADYDAFTYTDYGRRAFASGEATGYKTFTINATGLAAFNKAAINKYGIIMGDDMDNTYPCGTSSAVAAWQLNSQDNASNKPFMTITYTPAATTTVTKSGLGSLASTKSLGPLAA